MCELPAGARHRRRERVPYSARRCIAVRIDTRVATRPSPLDACARFVGPVRRTSVTFSQRGKSGPRSITRLSSRNHGARSRRQLRGRGALLHVPSRPSRGRSLRRRSLPACARVAAKRAARHDEGSRRTIPAPISERFPSSRGRRPRALTTRVVKRRGIEVGHVLASLLRCSANSGSSSQSLTHSTRERTYVWSFGGRSDGSQSEQVVTSISSG